MSGKIAFDQTSRDFILSAFGYTVDKDGFIISAKSKKRIMATDGKEILAKDIVAITKKGLFRRGIASVVELADTVYL